MNRSLSAGATGVKQARKNVQGLVNQLGMDYRKVVSTGVEDYLVEATRLMLEALMQAEVQHRVGNPYEHNGNRKLTRWGFEKGTAIVAGGKREVTRPRIRLLRNLADGKGELELETYKAMNRSDLMDGPLTTAILSGVSARRFASIASRGLIAKGVSKSAVSRKAIAATKPLVDDFLKRKLDHLDLVALLFDGIHIAKRQTIVCIGIDGNGRKHVLGLRIGATENDIVVRDLIRDLIDRGLSSQKQYLFVVDGSKALVQAIRAAFGQEAAIQRCQEHKIRDVQGYIPVKMRAEFRSKMQAAYNETTVKQALERLSKIRSELWRVSEGAVNALTEGMYETLTVHRLGITGLLRKSLRTTNIMESAFSSVRRYMGRVTQFKDESQIQLWVVRSLVETERHFRSVPGNRQIPKLKSKLATYKR